MHQLGPGHAHLYLVPGFDPHGSRTLVRLLQAELAQVDSRFRLRFQGHAGTLAHWQIQAAPSQALRSLTLLGWNDIVRRRWTRSPWRLFTQGLALYWNYLPQMMTIFWAHPKAGFTLLWPLVFWLLVGLLAVGPIAAVALLPWVASLQWLVNTVLVFVVFRWGLQQAERRRLGWLFRAIHFSASLGRGEAPELGERLDRFAEQLTDALQASHGAPITLVGHSTGCYLALHVMQRLLKAGVLAQWPGAVRLLTLGHNPAVLVSIHPDSPTRAAIAALLDAGLPWHDLTCGQDWMSFAQVDLLAVMERQDASGLRRSHVPLAAAGGVSGIGAVLSHQFVLHFQYFRHGLTNGFSCLEWLLPEWWADHRRAHG